MGKTTIQINFETLEKLKALKNFERQSYDELLNNLISNCQQETLSEEEIEDIQKGLEDVKKGKVYLIEVIARELGIALK